MEIVGEHLTGRVAVVTGAGRGLGRAHALALASQGAAVVVNDLGGDVHGEGRDATPAQEVVEEIRAAGGRAEVSGHDVSDWSQAEAMITLAIETFGDLHVLVNNAGILRDRMLANMAEDEWDSVVRVHLKGHAAPSRHAVAYWRARAKAGHTIAASVIHTTSGAGMVGSFGQANYGSAKLGVIALSQTIVTEMGRLGVRSNVISPMATSRMSQVSAVTVEGPETAALESLLEPANVSPVVAWLAEENCTVTGQVFHVYGNRVLVLSIPTVHFDARTDGQWTIEKLANTLEGNLAPRFDIDALFAEQGVATTTAPTR